ncbi:hypothetical protein ACP70R_035239 [Stipagrostis hirtigluma subsp. patula]
MDQHPDPNHQLFLYVQPPRDKSASRSPARSRSLPRSESPAKSE